MYASAAQGAVEQGIHSCALKILAINQSNLVSEPEHILDDIRKRMSAAISVNDEILLRDELLVNSKKFIVSLTPSVLPNLCVERILNFIIQFRGWIFYDQARTRPVSNVHGYASFMLEK